jgi:hypothetical protein
MVAPTTDTLFGIQETGPGSVWACGGDPIAQTGVVWHFDGESWAAPPDLDPDLLADFTPFKVWGESDDDLWIIGRGGVALHRTVDGWSEVDVPLGRPLLTVHGEGDLVIAVGGAASGHIVEVVDGALVDTTPDGVVPQLNGVFVRDGLALAAGAGGAIWARDADGVWTDTGAPTRLRDFHAVWSADDGERWAVGGNLFADPPEDGVLAHYGPSEPTLID